MNHAAQPGEVPPKLKAGRLWTSAYFSGALLAMVALGGALVVYSFDPVKTPFYPGCLFHQLTGLNCPGCGATRALYALLHGRWRVALHDNALFLVTGVALAFRAGWQAVRRWQNLRVKPFLSTRWLLLWMVTAMAFGVLRNLPPFAFLSP